MTKSATISRQADKWLNSFRFDVETQSSEQTGIVGVELGVKNLATLSSGEVIAGAKSYKKFEAKLSRMQSSNRHKIIGSANWKKAQIAVARVRNPWLIAKLLSRGLNIDPSRFESIFMDLSYKPRTSVLGWRVSEIILSLDSAVLAATTSPDFLLVQDTSNLGKLTQRFLLVNQM